MHTQGEKQLYVKWAVSYNPESTRVYIIIIDKTQQQKPVLSGSGIVTSITTKSDSNFTICL